jgi:hypothetical protein
MLPCSSENSASLNFSLPWFLWPSFLQHIDSDVAIRQWFFNGMLSNPLIKPVLEHVIKSQYRFRIEWYNHKLDRVKHPFHMTRYYIYGTDRCDSILIVGYQFQISRLYQFPYQMFIFIIKHLYCIQGNSVALRSSVQVTFSAFYFSPLFVLSIQSRHHR